VGEVHPSSGEEQDDLGEDGELLDDEELEIDEKLDDLDSGLFDDDAVLKTDRAGDVAADCGGLEGSAACVSFRTTIIDRVICFFASRLDMYSNAVVRGAGRFLKPRSDWPASRGEEI
jgi:hypothetical protein